MGPKSVLRRTTVCEMIGPETLPPLRILFFLVLVAYGVGSLCCAQLPDSLRFSIPPPRGTQQSAQFGYSVASSGPLTIVGSPGDSQDSDGDSGIAGVFNSGSGALLFTLKNPTPNTGDRFGCAVAISGSIAAVGANRDDTTATDAGIVYVYDLAGQSPTIPKLVLNNPAPAASDQFGVSLAMSGPYLVVGAPDDDAGATNSGTAYVYDVRTAATNPMLTLNNPSPSIEDRFAQSVAISGTQVVIGAPKDDTGASDAGSVYIYDLLGATPVIPRLTLNNPVVSEARGFGGAVATFGSIVVVGMVSDGTAATGRVYTYDLAGATPTAPFASLTDPTPTASGYFGVSVAIHQTRIVVGSRYKPVGASPEGRAYLYDLASTNPREPVGTFFNPSPATSSRFGEPVCISDSGIAVAAFQNSVPVSGSGTVYLYDFSSVAPTTPAVTLFSISPSTSDRFGYSVALSGTLAVVGAASDDTGTSNAGRVYVYDMGSTTPGKAILSFGHPNPLNDDLFGSVLAMSGIRIVVGSPFAGVAEKGSAHVFDLASPNPSLSVLTLSRPNPMDGDYFGNAVAISGDRVAVGTQNSHRVYIYDLNSLTPTVPSLVLPDIGLINSYLGQSLAIEDSILVVGEPGECTEAFESGRVCVYDLSSNTPSIPILTLRNPTPASGDTFGAQVALSGRRLLVAAPYDDSSVSNVGTVYLYDISSPSTAPVSTFNNPRPVADDRFGSTIAASGSCAAIGSLFVPTGLVRAGTVWVYHLIDGPVQVPSAVLNKPNPATQDNFGFSLALQGSTLIVGAMADNTSGIGKGFVYGYTPSNPDADDDGLLDLWEYAHFGSTSVVAGLDDSDKDGKVELVEMAFDTNPVVPDGSQTIIRNEAGYLTATLTKRAGVTYTVQSAANPSDNAFSQASTTILLDDESTLKVRDNFSSSGGGTRFMRVQVSSKPEALISPPAPTTGNLPNAFSSSPDSAQTPDQLTSIRLTPSG
jgi:hypothetical protein